MREKVYVLTDPERGWDCVIGVYKTKESLYKDVYDMFHLEPPITEAEKATSNEYIKSFISERDLIVHEVFLQS